MSAVEGSKFQEAMEAQLEAAPSPPPVAQPEPPRKLDEVDIMKLENAFLKVDNLRKAKALAEKEIQNVDIQLSQVQQGLIALRDAMSQKYGIDLTKARINTDGTILPNANPGLNVGNPIAQALGKN
jgi:hypothetical protein